LLSYNREWAVIYKLPTYRLYMSASNLVTLFTILSIVNYFIILGISVFYFFFYFSKLDKLLCTVLAWSAIIALTVILDRLGSLVFDRTSQAYLILTVFNYLAVCYTLIPLVSGERKLATLVRRVILNQVIIKQFYNLTFEGVLIGFKAQDNGQDTDFTLVDCNLALCKLIDKSRADILNNPRDIFDSETTKSLIEVIRNKTHTPINGFIRARGKQLIPVEITVQWFTVNKLDYFCLSVIDVTNENIIKKMESQNVSNLEKQFSLLSKEESLVKELLSNLDQLSFNGLANSDLQDLILQTEVERNSSALSKLSGLEISKSTPDEAELEKELFSKFKENGFSELVPSLDKLLPNITKPEMHQVKNF